MDLKKRFAHHWASQNFPQKKETVLVAVSGGKDSMALAHIMHEAGFSIALGHCNFQLRDTASNLDEQLVVNWAKEQSIPLHRIAFDTRKVMEDQKKGVQETARELRYSWFNTLCKEHGYAAVATAHHANDNAETLLINFCKGTGIAGLHGIPSRNGAIIRPLLFATGKEIENFVHSEDIPFREDASNASTYYLRNAVRHKVIPVLDEVFPCVVERLSENISRFKQVESIYRQAIESKKKKLLEQRGADFYIPVLKLKKEPAYETVCFELMSEFGFTAAQTPEILKLLNSESGHYVASASHKVIRNRMFLIITEQSTQKTDLILIEEFPATIETENGTFRFSVHDNIRLISSAAEIASIDSDTLSLPLTLRRWRKGDYFYPLGMGMKKKKVARFLVDQKIPVHQKEKLWVLEHTKQIIWIAGMRLDERFKIKPNTKKIVQVAFLSK